MISIDRHSNSSFFSKHLALIRVRAARCSTHVVDYKINKHIICEDEVDNMCVSECVVELSLTKPVCYANFNAIEQSHFIQLVEQVQYHLSSIK